MSVFRTVADSNHDLRPASIAAAYAAAAVLWTLVSKPLLADAGQFASLPGIRDLGFVAVTTMLLYLVLRLRRRGEDARIARTEQQASGFRTLFESNPNPMWVYDLETLAFLAVNDAAVASYGYTREEFLGMTIADIRPAEDVPALLRNVAKVSTGLDHAGIWRHRKKNGELIEVEIISSVLSFEGRRSELVVAHDVTAQRAAWRQVEEAEERLRLALSAARQGLYDLDLRTGVAVINDEYARMLGYAPGELAESNAAFAARLHPDDRERVARAYADYIAGKLPEYRVEFRQRTRQGDWKRIRSLGKVMERDAAGAPVRLLGTHTDIDEEKQAQARIRRLTNLYAALSRCNEAILRIEDRIELLREICRVAVDHGGLRMAWIGELQDGRVAPVASFGARTEYADGLDITLDADRASGRGPTAQAIREGRHVICDDVGGDPRMEPWRERALACGFRASAAFPLRSGSRTVGALNLYASAPRFFDAELVDLLDEMALDISFALDRFALRVGREAAERRFRVLVDHAADAVVVADLDGRIVDVNSRACESLGYSRDELLAMTVGDVDLTAAEMGAEMGKNIRAAAIAGSQPVYGRHRRKDGSTFPAEVRVAGVRLEDGDYVIGVARDISDRLKAEQALRESEARLRRIVDEMPVLLDAFDEQGRLIYWNRECERVTGYTAAEIVGNPQAMALLYPDVAYRERLLAAYREPGRENRDREWKLVARNGSTRLIAWSSISEAVPILGWAAWGVGVDVTARREAEAAAANNAQRLQFLSRRLLTVQEDERRALARELHDEVGQQLTALKINLDVLLRGSGAEFDKRRLTDCIEIADLTIERIRDTALNLLPAVLDDLGLVSALNWYARRQSERSGCRIHVGSAIPPLAKDVETALFRIVQEAVNNAVRHGNAQRIDIALDMVGDAVRVSVSDDGRGFDVSGSADSGVGLLSMRERTELLGGVFEVDSRAGGGTRVCARIPLDAEAV
jgi:PAS domain S-box-containing protein